MNVLSIQSWVAYGHVGNAAAILPLQLLGHGVWAVHTVQFSNHPGYGAFRGAVFDAKHVSEVTTGLAERGLLTQCDGLLSGYLGDTGTGAAVLETVKRLREANPRALYCCDPVMGDDKGGLFARPGIPDVFAQSLIPAADLVTPNRFELEQLTGTRVATIPEAITAARTLLARGPTLVVVTGLLAPVMPTSRAGTLAVSKDGVWLVSTPELFFAQTPNGTGDVLAALLLGRMLAGASIHDALSLAVSGLFTVLERAARDKLRELPLVAEQRSLASPGSLYPAERIA